MRRHYVVRLIVNHRALTEVIIDPHYEAKHSKVVTDAIVLHLVKQDLNGRVFERDGIDDEGFEYYGTEPHYYEDKPYRLVWTLHPKEKYLGVINCFRRPRGKTKIS